MNGHKKDGGKWIRILVLYNFNFDDLFHHMANFVDEDWMNVIWMVKWERKYHQWHTLLSLFNQEEEKEVRRKGITALPSKKKAGHEN